jgi:Ni/Co efflux regulator RcnB
MEQIMKLHALLCGVVATSLGLGVPAFAQGDGGPQPQGNSQQRQFQRADQQRGQRNVQQQRQRGWDQQQRERGDQRQERGRDGYREAYGAGQFHRGDRLPPEYRHRNYVVDDWRGHHLNAPPRGYHWVQVGGDYVLVAIATGVILQLLLNN